ncbi:MAG: acyl-CoA thioesterase [Candidatus Thermoplasmatota archaeon]|jgi:acyl-CoA thioester hydrolase|nr:acyl-CoA thioesterase [Candidatus Thermoplasmatota archaeon]
MRSTPLVTGIQVRYGDLDTLGHVNNAVYLTYFELGRVSFFRKHFDSFDLDSVKFVLARAELDFRKPITMDDPVVLETVLESVGKTSFTFSHRLLSQDLKTEYCTGKIIAVYLGKSGKPETVPEELRKLVEVA